MTYTKPEVKNLGEAKTVIEQMGHKPIASVSDGTQAFKLPPAYDLDE